MFHIVNHIHVTYMIHIMSVISVGACSFHNVHQLVEMIKSDILPTSTRAPKDFLEKLTAILNRGSIHSIADHYEGLAI